MTKIEQALNKLGITLPTKNDPVAQYLPCRREGDLLLISGQTCKWNGELVYSGAVGHDITVEEGVKAAELCALNLLLQVKVFCKGDLGRLVSCVKLTVFVNSRPDFKDHPVVANGASELLVKCLGDAGRHARSTVGVCSLPGSASVEIEGVFKIT